MMAAPPHSLGQPVKTLLLGSVCLTRLRAHNLTGINKVKVTEAQEEEFEQCHGLIFKGCGAENKNVWVFSSKSRRVSNRRARPARWLISKEGLTSLCTPAMNYTKELLTA